MSWKSETRRKVEHLLDAYHVETIGLANLAAELSGMAGDEDDDDHRFNESNLGDLTTYYDDGPLLSEQATDHMFDVFQEITGRWNDRHERYSFVLAVVLAREIERGLLG